MVFLLFAFSDGCCPRIDWYWNGEKEQGSFIIQAEKVNENCHYVLEGGKYGIWMCGDRWWIGFLFEKGQCNGDYYASTDSKPNVRVQNDSLQWKWADGSGDVDLNFNCIDLCL